MENAYVGENRRTRNEYGVGCDRACGHGMMAFPTASQNTERRSCHAGAFTPAQWMELQRQALIYKYIVASAPIPSYLLFSMAYSGAPYYNIIPYYPGFGMMFNLDQMLQGMQPELRRCRRTDGKKWRCSRDAAPDQKYCERHMHRGRPRSRKPVEKTHKTNSSDSAPSADASTAATNAAAMVVSNDTCTDSTKSGLLNFNTRARGFEWTKANNREMEAIRLPEQRENKLNLNYSSITEYCCPFLDPNLNNINEEAGIGVQIATPRDFIDAWSTENATGVTSANDNLSSLSNCGNDLAHSALSLSISGTEPYIGLYDQPVSWMAPPSSLGLGGPLGEALKSTNQTSPPASPMGNLSPSGALQRGLVSLSDCSSSSNSIFAATAACTEMAMQWAGYAEH